MSTGQSSAFSELLSHPALDLKSCPTCGQEIPPDKVEEIGGRIAARERERTLAVTSQLEERYAVERERAKTAAKADLESERRQSAIREARARDEAQQAAENVFKQKLADTEQNQAALVGQLRQELAAAESARRAAEETWANLQAEMKEVRANSTTAIEEIKAEAKRHENEIREEAKRTAELAAAERIAAIETAQRESQLALKERITEAEASRIAAEQNQREAETKLSAITDQQAATMEANLNAQREVLEKAMVDAVNTEKSRAFEENQKLATKLTELQHAFEKKTAEELGEGAELNLYEALKKEFPDDDIRRVSKGKEGADILHVVMQSGKKCGTIIYDSKNHNQFRWEHVTKLRADQLAAEAEHAILSTRKFPEGTRQLHLHDGVLLANPARVVIVATMIRQHVLRLHTQRIGDIERKAKTAALYNFIVSERFSSLLARVDERAEDLLKEQEKEIKWHKNQWKREGEAIRAIQKARAELENQVSRIIGTSADTEAA